MHRNDMMQRCHGNMEDTEVQIYFPCFLCFRGKLLYKTLKSMFIRVHLWLIFSKSFYQNQTFRVSEIRNIQLKFET